MLHEKPSDSIASIVRITVFGIWILKFSFDPLQRIAELPLDFFDSPFPLGLLPIQLQAWLLTPEALVGLRLVGAISCGLCLSSKLLRIFVPIAFLSAIHYQCLVRGFGHINHAEVVALLAVLAYLICAYSKNAGTHPEPFIVSLALCFSYTLIAANRFAFGGIHVFTSDTMPYWAANNSALVSYFDFKFGALAMTSTWFPLFLKMGFLAVTICELLAPFSLIYRRFRIPFFLTLLGFHIGVLVMMNILFWENMALLATLFLPEMIGSRSQKLSKNPIALND